MKRTKIDKKDQYRALLTDTPPGDVPIIFSNDGLYVNLHSMDLKHSLTSSSIFGSILKRLLRAEYGQSSPYLYSIKKDEISLRTLSLTHPRVQINFCDFYQQYSNAITYLCSKSNFSIRSPRKIANSFYSSDSDKSTKYKEIDIDTLETELHRRHASSYFTYAGYTRIYKFFSSPYYTILEKRFPSLWMIDVANCFDSIYTHSISWAVKGKPYSKRKVGFSNQFCSEFDRLVQRSNRSETNGIPIGSEVSRVFAEVIFQEIDRQIELTIKERFKYELHDHYVLLRYVDDFVLFGIDDEVCENVAMTVSDCLKEFNLYINDSKLKKYQRPFITEKSYAISQTQRVINEFEPKVFTREAGEAGRFIQPRKIGRQNAVIKMLIEQIKNVCHIDGLGYSGVSSYLVSTISNRMLELVGGYGKFLSSIGEGDEGDAGDSKRRYRDLILVYLRLLFFFYAVNPQVTASQKLAKTIIVVDQFFLKECNEFLDNYRTRVMSEIKALKLDISDAQHRAKYISIETLNVLVATGEFGPNYLIDKDVLLDLLSRTKDRSYFTLVSILYYIKDQLRYLEVRECVEKIVREKFAELPDLRTNAELAHLFLDLICCPYISDELRKELLECYLSRYESCKSYSDAEKLEMLQSLIKVFWFVKWKDLDLIKLLERKELNSRY